MKRLSKAILIALGCVAALGVALIFGVNLYLQSPGVQARIQEGLSKALHMPLTITNTSLTPWSDLRINGITVPTEKGNFLEASSFSASYRLWPLLQKQLVISEMRIESPRVVWTQTPEGKWILPERAKSTGEKKEARTPAPESKPKKSDFEVLVSAFKVSNGSIDFVDKEGRHFATLNGVEMHYSILTTERVEGTLEIGHVAYGDGFFFEKVTTPLIYASGQLSLPKFHADLAGGAVDGSFSLEPKTQGAPFTVSLRFDQIDLEHIAKDAQWTSSQASGKVSGTLDAQGLSRDIDRLEGKGKIVVTQGNFRQLDFFRAIGDILRFPELSEYKPDDAHAEYRLGDAKVFIDQLVLASPDIRFTANGTARFDKKLALDARFTLSETAFKRVPPWLSQYFGAGDEAGWHAIDLKVTGKTDKPKTDLLERLVGNKISSQLDNILSQVLGEKKKEKKPDEKKKDDKKRKDKDKDKDKDAAAAQAANPPPDANQKPPASPPAKPVSQP